MLLIGFVKTDRMKEHLMIKMRLVVMSLMVLVPYSVVWGAEPFVPAEISVDGGAVGSYDLVDEPVKVFSPHGMFSYRMSDIMRMGRSETGSVVQVETRAGDLISGNLITENIPYLFFDEKKWIELSGDKAFSLTVKGAVEMNIAPDAVGVVLTDGTRQVGQMEGQVVEIKQGDKNLSLPIASMSKLMVLREDRTEQEGEDPVVVYAYDARYVGNGQLAGVVEKKYAKFEMEDFFGHRSAFSLEDIKAISNRLYEALAGCCGDGVPVQAVELTMRDGRVETVTLPFWFVELEGESRNSYRIPSFYVQQVETIDGRTVLTTVFGERLAGTLKNRSIDLLIPNSGAETGRVVSVGVESIALVKYQEREAIKHVSPLEVHIGEERLCGELVAGGEVRVSSDEGTEETLLQEGIRGMLRREEDGQWQLYSHDYPEGVDAEISARYLEYVAFCDGQRHSLRWRDVEQVVLNGGISMPDAVPSDEIPDMEPDGDAMEPGADMGAHPRMRPGHVLQIHVLVTGETEIEEPERRITSSGEISLPLLGAVKVDTFTLEQLERHLTERYREYFRAPQVVVQYVMSEKDTAVSPWGSVTVLGTVKEPGKVNIPPTQDLTVSMAIQQAGGFDSSANDKSIMVTRISQGETKQFEVNLRNAGARGAVEEDLMLEPGDIVYVPEMMF
jgi:polysaccharide export outer membrane protein